MIVVSIWRKTLEREGACSGGIALFDRIASMQSGADPRRLRRIRIRWTPLADIWLRATYPGFAEWLHDRGLAPQLSLARANLRGANLRGANLYGAYLRGAYLCDANLCDAYLRGAYLCDANLRGACLRGADLRGADLRGAYLYGADLYGADLRGAYRGSLEAPAGWENGADGCLQRKSVKS